MTPEEFAAAVRRIVETHAGHDAHRQLDELVTELLTGLGYGEGMRVFREGVAPFHRPPG